MEVTIMAYLKKFLSGANRLFRTKNLTSCLSDSLWRLFTILRNERGHERHGNYMNGFSERNLVHSNLVILERM